MRVLLPLLTISIALFAGIGGTYKGTYTGGGASGDITFVFTPAGGDVKTEVTFGLGGETVKTKVTETKIEGSKIRVVYQFDLQGTTLESTVTGEIKGSELAGEYQTKSADGSPVDQGAWKTTRQ